MAAGRWRRFVVRPFVWLLAIAALAVLALRGFLASDLARSRAREFAEARLTEALGRRVTIERVDYELVPFRFAVHGLEIASDRPGEPPLARLAAGEIEGDLDGLRSRVLGLRRVALHGLDVALVFREDGSDNLPRFPAGGRGAGLAVRIGGLSVDDGRVRVDERTAPFSLDASAVLARLVGADGDVLDGTVAAQQVTLVLPGARPLEVAVAGGVRLEGSRLALRHVRVTERDLDLRADGTVELTKPAKVAIHTRVATSAALLDRLGWLHGELGGALAFDGDVRWRPQAWSVEGELRSPRFEAVGFDLEGIAGQVHGGPKGFELALSEGTWSGGELRGTFAVDLVPSCPTRLAMRLDRARLASVLERFEVPVRDVRGEASGEFRYDFSLLDAERGVGAGEFTIAPEALADGGVAAAEGEIGVRLSEGVVELAPIRWSAGGQSVVGEGDYRLAAREGSFDLRARSEEVGGLVRLLSFLDARDLWVPSGGTAELTTHVALSGPAATVAIDFAAGSLEAKGFRATRASGSVVATAAAVAISHLELERPGARLALAGTIPLGDGPGLDLTIDVDGWPVEEAAPWLPFALPASGPARGRLHLLGSLAALRGEGEIELAPARVAEVDVSRLRAHWSWDPRQLELAAASFELAAGTVSAHGRLNLQNDELAIELPAAELALDRAPFDALGRGSMSGLLRIGGSLRGTLGRPDLRLAGTFESATLAGHPLPADPPSTVQMDWTAGKLAARVELAGVARLEGGGDLVPDADAKLHFTLSSDHADRLAELVTGTPTPELQGSVTADLDTEWPRAGALSLALRVPELALTWQGRPLRSREPLALRLDGDSLTLDSVYLQVGEADDELFVGGRIRLTTDPLLDLHVEADVGAVWAGPLLGGLDLGGRLRLLANLRGSGARPEWSGQGEWSDGRFIPPALPHSFERGQALVLLYPQAVVLDGMTGLFAGGTIAASGRVNLAAGLVKDYRFEVAARGLSVRWPAGWQLRGDADLTLASTRSGRQIAGQARLDRIFYFQDLDLSPTQLLARLLSRARVVVPETDEMLSSTALDVAISAPGALRIRNNVADLSGSADLALRGSLARPVLFGDVNTAPGSKVIYNGNTFVVDRGHLAFANSARIDPQLDIVARTRIDEYDVLLNVGGVLSRPITSFSADPPLPDLDILGLLSTGRTIGTDATQVASGSPATSPSSASAEALLYGQAASLVGARVGRLFGFDQVRVEPLTSGDTVSTARVTVGKRLSRRLSLTYSVDPSTTAQQILQIEWRASDQLVLVLTQNGNESYSLDAKWESRF